MVFTVGYKALVSDLPLYLESIGASLPTIGTEKEITAATEALMKQAVETCQLDGKVSLTEYCEAKPVGLNFTWLSRIATAYYFAYFLIILPVLGMVEKPLERPESITKAVLGDSVHAAPAE